MALVRFANFAVEWNRIYAARRIAGETDERSGEHLLLFVDDPSVAAGQAAAPICDVQKIDAAWKHVRKDGRFAIIGTIAIDKSKVCAVSRSADGRQGSLSFDLGNGRGAVLVIDPDLAALILETIPESTGKQNNAATDQEECAAAART